MTLERNPAGWFALLIFNLLNYTDQTFKYPYEIPWRDIGNPWNREKPQDLRNVIFVLNVKNYKNSSLEKRYITSGILIDNSRILTSFTPFKELIFDESFASNLMVMLATGGNTGIVKRRIGNLVCGRQLQIQTEDDKKVWKKFESKHSPVHDIAIFRMESEIGLASSSLVRGNMTDYDPKEDFNFKGEAEPSLNALYTPVAKPGDTFRDDDVRISSLGYRDKDEIRRWDTIVSTEFTAEDQVMEDCEEWIPKTWGVFICIKNVENFAGVGSGASLISDNKLFGIGCFAMFRKNTGILVFTDVRPYHEQIHKACGDKEVELEQ